MLRNLDAGNENIILSDQGLVTYDKSWLPFSIATQYFDALKASLDWQQEQIILFGKIRKCPRLTTWYADDGINYRYSGIDHFGTGWQHTLFAIKEYLQLRTGQFFNSVLCNYYRDENDSMGWHSDNESELGVNPTIASISFGAQRRFTLKNKLTKQTVSIDLTHGSLLLMQNETQHFWQHTLPKTKKICGERINLTFRLIR